MSKNIKGSNLITLNLITVVPRAEFQMISFPELIQMKLPGIY